MRGPQSAGPSVIRSNALTFKVFTAGQTPGFPASAFAADLALGPDGAMWFTDGGTPAIGRIATDGTITEFTSGLPSGATPDSIIAGPDGNMWFSDNRGVALGKITPQGAITEYDAPQYDDTFATGIAFGPNGDPWIVGFGEPSLLAHLQNGTITTQLLPDRMSPEDDLTNDASGNLWFLGNNAQLRALLLENPANGKGLKRVEIGMHRQLGPCCANKAAKSITIGPDGHLWFTTLDYGFRHSGAAFLGTLRGGKVQLIRIHRNKLSETAVPSGIAANAKGLWITGGDPLQDNGALWHIGTGGKQTAYDLPYDPLGLAVDGAGHPWFTAIFSDQPSRIVEVTP